MKDEISRNLIASSLFKSRDDVRIYEDSLYEIYLKKDAAYIDVLLSSFHDETEFHEVMYGVVHLLESFPVDEYIEHLVKNIPTMINTSPFWLGILVNRIFNEGVHIGFFEKQIGDLPKDKVSKFIDLMNKEYVHHNEILKTMSIKMLG